MFKERYHGANAYVDMTEGLDRSMLAKLGTRRRRITLSIVALVMALLVLAPWVASNPAAYQWLSRVAPPLAHLLLPSADSAEENGIRAEAADVTREGDTLLVHITLEDLQGNRLNGNTYPEWWTYEQFPSQATGHCSQEYDTETGLLHLYLTFEPKRNTPDFDWGRWVTVSIHNLRTRTNLTEEKVPIPLTLTDGTPFDHPFAGGRSIRRMTVIGEEFHVEVCSAQLAWAGDYRLILSGPHGEQIHLDRQLNGEDSTTWVFDLRDRDIQECTLTAFLDPVAAIEGTWSLTLNPDQKD